MKRRRKQFVCGRERGGEEVPRAGEVAVGGKVKQQQSAKTNKKGKSSVLPLFRCLFWRREERVNTASV